MSTPTAPHPTHLHQPMAVDNAPPRRSKITGGLAALACAFCCTIPFLIAAGIVTGAGAAILEQTLVAVAAGLAVLALGMWWWNRRRQAAKSAAGADRCSDPSCNC